jgi:uncharacterized protein (TIGR03067 family)
MAGWSHLMSTSLFIGLALGVVAPGPKDDPKKAATIVGKWAVEKMTVGGKDPGTPSGAIGLEFIADGTLLSRLGTDNPKSSTYKVDPKKDPAEIDIIAAAGVKRPPSLGIYKLDGDTLTLCFDQEPGAARPKAFESPAGTIVMVWTLKRVKKE